MNLSGSSGAGAQPSNADGDAAPYRLEGFFLLTPDPMCVARRDGQLLVLNPAWETALGYPLDQLSGTNCLDYVHPDDRDATAARLTRISAADSEHFINRYRGADGTYRWFEWHARLEGELIYATARDISDRREAEERLKESEARWRRLFESTPDGMLLLDDTSGAPVIADCNAAICTATGYTRDELIGQPIMKLRPPEVTEEDVRARARRVREAGTLTMEMEYQRKDGTRYPIEAAVSTIRLDGREMSLAVERDISARKAAEQALRESEERFAEFMDHVPALCFVKDPSSRIVYMNRRFRETHGADDWLGKRDAEVWTVADAERLHAIDRRVLEFGEEVRVEEEFPLGEESHSFLTAKFPMHGPGNTPLVGAVSIDITEQKRAERALRESETRWRRLFDQSPDGLILIDDSTGLPVITDCNPAMVRMSGYSRDELLGQPILRLTGPRVTETDARNRLKLIHGSSTAAWETEYRRKDGAVYPVEASASAIALDGLPMTLAVVRDVSARKAAEESLREQERLLRESSERYRAIVEASPIAMTVHRNRTILFANQAAAAMFRVHSPGDLEGLDVEDFEHPDDRDKIRRRVAQFAAGATALPPIEERLLRADGEEFPAEVSAVQVMFDSGPANIVVMTDLSERKRYERQLRQMNEELEERVAQRTEALAEAKDRAEAADRAKSALLSRASHELRTPLNSILGFAQLLALDELEPAQEESVEHILRAGSHLLDLVDEVLDIARIETGRLALSLTATDLTELVRDAVDLVSPLAMERGVTISSLLSDGQASVVSADSQRLKQVVLNLLSNAIKYNRPQGSVTITAEEIAGGTVRLSVSDTGPGIPPDKLGLLFNPFERLGAEATGVQGTGLGLALSRALVEAMGATIGAASVPGTGSTFWIELPAASVSRPAVRPAATPVPPAPLPGGPQRPRRVLYIEDNVANLKLVESLVKRWHGVTLISAMQGRLGLDLAAEEPDVIILDLHLPDISGHEMLQRLKSDPRTRDIPVLVASADATQEQIGRALKAGALEYFTKPLDIRKFLDVLSRVLGEAAERP